MPRHVDIEARRADILSAAYEVLAESGPPGLSFRAIAARLGGSATLVIHYYPSRQLLIEDLIAFAVDRWKEELATLEMGIEEPLQRLGILLRWFLPIDDDALKEERTRLNLLVHHWEDDVTHVMLREWEKYANELVRQHLEPLVSAADVERTVEILRVTTNGITLLAIQDPEQWPERRQVRVLSDELARLGLADAIAPARS